VATQTYRVVTNNFPGRRRDNFTAFRRS
jgi:hypothetical protein